MNVLADRASAGLVRGNLLAEANYSGTGFAKRIGYAQQQDIHLPTSTVREALQFSALLRQSANYSRKEKLAYVEEVIEMLDMWAFVDAIVGVPGEGWSLAKLFFTIWKLTGRRTKSRATQALNGWY